jgi:hypothetical protein
VPKFWEDDAEVAALPASASIEIPVTENGEQPKFVKPKQAEPSSFWEDDANQTAPPPEDSPAEQKKADFWEEETQAEAPQESQNPFEDDLQAESKAQLQQQAAERAQEEQAQAEQQAQEQAAADPRNWSSQRFKKEAPKPTTPEEQAVYNQTLAEKEHRESELAIEGQDVNAMSSTEFSKLAPKPKTVEEKAIYDATLAEKKAREEELKTRMKPEQMQPQRMDIPKYVMESPLAKAVKEVAAAGPVSPGLPIIQAAPGRAILAPYEALTKQGAFKLAGVIALPFVSSQIFDQIDKKLGDAFLGYTSPGHEIVKDSMGVVADLPAYAAIQGGPIGSFVSYLEAKGILKAEKAGESASAQMLGTQLELMSSPNVLKFLQYPLQVRYKIATEIFDEYGKFAQKNGQKIVVDEGEFMRWAEGKTVAELKEKLSKLKERIRAEKSVKVGQETGIVKSESTASTDVKGPGKESVSKVEETAITETTKKPRKQPKYDENAAADRGDRATLILAYGRFSYPKHLAGEVGETKGQWRRSMGKLRRFLNSDAQPLDGILQELKGVYPHLFNKYETDADLLRAILNGTINDGRQPVGAQDAVEKLIEEHNEKEIALQEKAESLGVSEQDIKETLRSADEEEPPRDWFDENAPQEKPLDAGERYSGAEEGEKLPERKAAGGPAGKPSDSGQGNKVELENANELKDEIEALTEDDLDEMTNRDSRSKISELQDIVGGTELEKILKDKITELEGGAPPAVEDIGNEKAIIEAAGGKEVAPAYHGRTGPKDLIQFQLEVAGNKTTLAIQRDNITPENVQKKIEAKRKQFEAADKKNPLTVEATMPKKPLQPKKEQKEIDMMGEKEAAVKKAEKSQKNFLDDDEKKSPSGSGQGATSEELRVGAFKVEPQGGVIPNQVDPKFKLADKVLALIKKNKVNTVGEGYNMKHAIGTYHHGTENVRLQAINQVNVAVHEITHHLDNGRKIVGKFMARTGVSKSGNPIYDSRFSKERKALTKIYVEHYAGGKKNHKLEKRLAEGLAVLSERMIQDPAATRQNYPELVSWFLQKGGKHYQADMAELVKDGQEIIREYSNLDPLSKIGSRTTSDTRTVDRDSFLNFNDRVIQEIFDAVYPIEKLAKKAGFEGTGADPSNYMRVYNNIPSIVVGNINGTKGYWSFRKTGKPMGGGTEFALKKIHDFNWGTLQKKMKDMSAVKDFGDWLVARQQKFAYDELDQLKERAVRAMEVIENAKEELLSTKTELQEAVQTVKEYKQARQILKNDAFTREEVTEAYDEHKDRFKELEKMFDQLTRADLELMADPAVGLITPKQFAKYSTREGYASLKREVYDELVGEGEAMVKSRPGPAAKISSTLHRTGSQKTIIHPVFNGIKNHHEIMKKAMKQVVINKVAGLSKEFPELFQKMDLKSKKEGDKILFPQERDPNILMARDGAGKRVPYLVDKELKRIIDEVLTPEMLNNFEKILVGFSRWFTKSTTGLFPQFAITNIVRDQITAVSQTDVNYIPLYDTLKQWGKALANNDSQEAKFLTEYLVLGGERQTLLGWQDLSPNELNALLTGEQNALQKIIKLADDGLSFLSKQSEIATRASEYIKARKAGKDQLVSLEMAGRVSAPFHHSGRYGRSGFFRVWQQAVPYLKAAFQVFGEASKRASDKKTAKRWWAITAGLAAAYIASQQLVWRVASEDQKNQFKDITPEEKSNFIYFPLFGGQGLGRIATSPQLSFLGNLINMAMLEGMSEGKAHFTAGEYIGAATAMIPTQMNILRPWEMLLSVIPQFGRVPLEVIFEKKTYPRVYDLIPRNLQDEEPKNQYTDYTSKLAKWLGGKLNLSPIKIDHLLTGFAGRGITQFTGKEFQNPLAREYYFNTGRTVQRFWTLKDENDKKFNSIKDRRDNFTKEEEAKIIFRHKTGKHIQKLLKLYRETKDEVSLRAQRENIIKTIEDAKYY